MNNLDNKTVIIPVTQTLTISLCMIVKNEEQLLAQALNSVKDLVDEMIIVDTGSTDKTVEIAKSFDGSINSITKKPISVKIIYFPWINDFSAARNESLKHASGDWILVLDADETINQEDHEKIRLILEEIEEEAEKKMKVEGIVVQRRNYSNNQNSFGFIRQKTSYNNKLVEGYFDTPHITLFKNNIGIEYYGVVHEFQGIDKHPLSNLTTASLIINHWTNLQEGKTEAKQHNYFNLLKKTIEADVTLPYHYHALGIAAVSKGEFELVEKCFQKCIDNNYMVGESYFFFGVFYSKTKQYVQAREAYEKASLHLSSQPQKKAEALYKLGLSYVQNNEKVTPNNIQKASEFFFKSIMQYPTAKAYLDLGNSFLQLKKYQQALDAYNQALILGIDATQENKIKNYIKKLRGLL